MSLPIKFLEKYKLILDKKEFEKFVRFCEMPLRKSIRINTLKITVKDFLKHARSEWWELTQIPWCKEWFWIDREDRSKPLWKSYLHVWWFFYIQEASSMIPPEVLEPAEFDKVLDLSAAPWSKATQMSAMMKNKWLLILNEIDSRRLTSMRTNLDRLWVLNYLITEKDWMAFSQYFPNYFDKVLLDAPCTGEWTIRKDKSALNFWNEKWIQKLASLQKRLIKEAFHTLKPGGELVYSTCTLSPEENEYVVLDLLNSYKEEAELIPINRSWTIKKNNEFWLDWVLRVWPHDFDTEWFFVAKIKKTKETVSEFYSWIKPWTRKSPFTKVKKINETPIARFLKNKNEKIENIWKKWDEFWYRPKWVEEILTRITSNCSWLLLWKMNKKWEFDFNFEGALAFEHYLNFEFIELNEEELSKFLNWYDLQNNVIKEWLLFIKYQWLLLWFWKVVWDKIKNKLPTNLIYT